MTIIRVEVWLPSSLALSHTHYTTLCCTHSARWSYDHVWRWRVYAAVSGMETVAGCSSHVARWHRRHLTFMPSTQLTFFGKMAILITLTIAFAFAYSLVFFVGLCALIGPVGTFGNLSHMYVLFVVGVSGCDAGADLHTSPLFLPGAPISLAASGVPGWMQATRVWLLQRSATQCRCPVDDVPACATHMLFCQSWVMLSWVVALRGMCRCLSQL